MACACKVGQQIQYIEKVYGDSSSINKEELLSSEKLKIYVGKFLLYTLSVPFIPIATVYILCNKIFGNGKMSIDKILNIKKKYV